MKISFVSPLLVHMLKFICHSQRRIQNPVKHLRWIFFAKTVHCFLPLNIFAKSFIIDVWLSPECASDLSVINFNDEWKRGLRVSASYMDCESLLQTDKKYWILIIKQLLTYLAKPNQVFFLCRCSWLLVVFILEGIEPGKKSNQCISKI